MLTRGSQSRRTRSVRYHNRRPRSTFVPPTHYRMARLAELAAKWLGTFTSSSANQFLGVQGTGWFVGGASHGCWGEMGREGVPIAWGGNRASAVCERVLLPSARARTSPPSVVCFLHFCSRARTSPNFHARVVRAPFPSTMHLLGIHSISAGVIAGWTVLSAALGCLGGASRCLLTASIGRACSPPRLDACLG